MENKLARGFFFDRPSEKSPEFVKGRMSIKVEEAIPFLQESKNDKGYVNLDLLVSKAGKLYLKLNDFKPKDSQENKGIEYPTEEINPEDVPF